MFNDCQIDGRNAGAGDLIAWTEAAPQSRWTDTSARVPVLKSQKPAGGTAAGYRIVLKVRCIHQDFSKGGHMIVVPSWSKCPLGNHSVRSSGQAKIKLFGAPGCCASLR